jgi:hypothetical protein
MQAPVACALRGSCMEEGKRCHQLRIRADNGDVHVHPFYALLQWKPAYGIRQVLIIKKIDSLRMVNEADMESCT